ncbi:TIGR03619 family F420-dependent LLM class oxidoreductase [Allonocardiopsis opalescens]|uniref:Putative F420-dependent oxidoreductase n=1 Tax=Allonocardiopsis opalescens TaxID=1144618 RepID=A0A2T0PY88_9ACTN|nr:TIGR03619 family F420-dependent LLM class oxidoreductase [Allonocardiopsis opalescens]PRX96490.1 putative F420-dependent oxidoreductase [Allonocardiopsis opalescens]
MKIGFGAPVAGAWATPRGLADFAIRAEALGYDSLWTFHRLLVAEGDEVAPVYRSVLDPLVALGFAAGITKRIRLGVALVNLPFVSPVYLAKQASTLDVLSNGRLDLGLGIGWSPVEFAATGAVPKRRGARAEEYLRVLDTLWNDEISSFEGEFYTVPPAAMQPKPVQPGGPPVLLGGAVPAALRRAGRLASGWMSRSATDLDRIGEGIAIVKQAAADAGRDPDAVRVVVRGVVRAEPGGAGVPGPDGRRLRLSGSYELIREDAAWLAEQGVTELYYDLNWDPAVGHPKVSEEAAADRAGEIMAALAPGAG